MSCKVELGKIKWECSRFVQNKVINAWSQSSCGVLQAGRQHQLRAEYYAINQLLYNDRGTLSPVPEMQIRLTLPEESLFTQALCLLPGGCGEAPCMAGRGQWPLSHLPCLMASSGSFLDTSCCCQELFLLEGFESGWTRCWREGRRWPLSRESFSVTFLDGKDVWDLWTLS